jgi:hypothetical protein
MTRLLRIALWLSLLLTGLWWSIFAADDIIVFDRDDPASWPAVGLRWVCVALLVWLTISTLAMVVSLVPAMARWRPHIALWSPGVVRRIVAPVAVSLTSMSLLSTVAMAAERGGGRQVAVATMTVHRGADPVSQQSSVIVRSETGQPVSIMTVDSIASPPTAPTPVTAAPTATVPTATVPTATVPTATVPTATVPTVTVPTARMTVDPLADVSTDPTEDDTHVVSRNEHFWSIATDELSQELGRTPTQSEVATYWRQLIDANRQVLRHHNNPNLLYVGQQLDLPSSSTAE